MDSKDLFSVSDVRDLMTTTDDPALLRRLARIEAALVTGDDDAVMDEASDLFEQLILSGGLG